jgi:hypothetical protein
MLFSHRGGLPGHTVVVSIGGDGSYAGDWIVARIGECGYQFGVGDSLAVRALRCAHDGADLV